LSDFGLLQPKVTDYMQRTTRRNCEFRRIMQRDWMFRRIMPWKQMSKTWNLGVCQGRSSSKKWIWLLVPSASATSIRNRVYIWTESLRIDRSTNPETIFHQMEEDVCDSNSCTIDMRKPLVTGKKYHRFSRFWSAVVGQCSFAFDRLKKFHVWS
jgi:hypothetical protein